jgi:hypothetical protein
MQDHQAAKEGSYYTRNSTGSCCFFDLIGPSSCRSPTAKNRTDPQKTVGYKLSNDWFFVEKVSGILGLYLNPADKAVLHCIDENIQIQVFDRTQPLLPMGLGYVEGVTHDTIRDGTTTLFAALEVATGSVIAECKARHRHQELLSFLRRIEKEVSPDLDVHLIVDNPMHSQAPRSPLLVGAAATLPCALLAKPRILALSRLNAGLESILSERYEEEVVAVSKS